MNFHGRGIGTALYKELLSLLRQQNYFRAFAGITLPNEASVALHESLGFKHLGTYGNVGFKLGKWHDVGCWEITLNESMVTPAEPKTYSN